MFQNMVKPPKSFEAAMAADEADQEWKIGDCVNVNDVEQPCGRLVAVVVGIEGSDLLCQYLNASREFDYYNEPPMRNPKSESTKISDFGVVITDAGHEYWCSQTAESKATYSDGKPRHWQDKNQSCYRGREDLMKLVFPKFGKQGQ